MIKMVIIGLLLMICGIITMMYIRLNRELKKNIEIWKEKVITKEEE